MSAERDAVGVVDQTVEQRVGDGGIADEGAGMTSLGVMVAVNFAIGSDFKYLPAGLGAFWAIAVLLVCADRTSAQ